jgi:hypothetical protein
VVGRSGAVRIGVAIADMSEFEAIDPAYGIGDQRRHVECAITTQLAAEPLPIGEPELVFRTFSSTSIEHKRQVADEFAADGVLAVVGARDFTYAAVRLAETHHVPVVDVNAVPTAVLDRCAPWMFTVRGAQDLVYLTYVAWAHRTGRLAGCRIGVFSDRYTARSAAVAIDRLASLGHRPVVHVESDGVGVGSDHDVSAAERFAEAGVELVMPFVSGSSMARMLRALTATGGRVSVLDLETGEHVTDVSGSVMPPELYDGTPALAMSRVGEVAAGLPFDPVAEAAVVAVEAATGRTIARAGRDSSGELSNVLIIADAVAVLIGGLRNVGAGGDDRAALVAGIETISQMASASGGRISYRPGEHWGCRQMREIVWRDGAWRVVGEYAQMFASPA